MIKVTARSLNVTAEVKGSTEQILTDLVKINVAVLDSLTKNTGTPIAVYREIVWRSVLELTRGDIRAAGITVDLDAIKKMRGDAHEPD